MENQNSAQSKSFTRVVLKGLFWSSGGAGAIKVISIGITFLILARLTLREYGTYQLVLAAWGLFTTFFLQGLDQIIQAEGARLLKRDEKSIVYQLGSGFFVFKLAVGIIVWLITFWGSTLLAHYYSADILGYLKILSFTFLIFPFERLINYNLLIRLRFFAVNLYAFLEEIIRAVVIVVALLYVHTGVAGLIWGTVISMGLTVLLFLFTVETAYFRNFSFAPFFRLVIGQGKWNIMQKYIRQAEKNIRPFFIQYFLGREAVALFALAEKLTLQIVALMPISSVLIPLLSSEIDNVARLQRTLEKGVKYSAPVFAFVAIVAGLAAHPFLRFLFPQYLPALGLFYILLMYFPLVGAGYILTSFFFSHHEQRASFYLALARFSLFLVSAPVLIKFWGLPGVAFEYIATIIAADIFLRYWSLVKIHPELKIRFKHLVQIDSYDRALWQRLRRGAFHL